MVSDMGGTEEFDEILKLYSSQVRAEEDQRR